MYTCPKCKNTLIRKQKMYICSNGHCYDIASSGYVNLLGSAKGQGNHGDNKEMISARKQFLSLGHYFIIVEQLQKLIKEFVSVNAEIKILDCGCGEGYYTSALKERLNNCSRIYGMDVSKDAIISASKAYKNVDFSVGSVNSLPFANESFDVVLSLFAPLSESEFSRVLKNNGIMITVSPSPSHLIGLKEVIYDTVYLNPPTTFNVKLFEMVHTQTATSNMRLTSNEQIMALFKMTPYYYNTKRSDAQKLDQLNELETEIGFTFCVYKKIN